MKTAARFFFYSSFFISLCAFGLVCETYLLTNLPVDFRVAGLIFFATLFLYNFDSLQPYKTAQQQFLSEKKSWLLQHRRFLVLLSGMSAAAAFSCFLLVAQQLPVGFLLPFLLVSVLYSLPLIPLQTGKIPLRDVPFLKVFLIALVWAGLTVLLPVIASGKSISELPVLVLALRRFLFIFALTLLFDIRDKTKDAAFGTLTFPVKFGIGFTKKLAWFALLLFVVFVHFQETGPIRTAFELSAIAAGLVIYFAHEKRPEYYFAILADGMMLLQFLIVLAFS